MIPLANSSPTNNFVIGDKALVQQAENKTSALVSKLLKSMENTNPVNNAAAKEIQIPSDLLLSKETTALCKRALEKLNLMALYPTHPEISAKTKEKKTSNRISRCDVVQFLIKCEVEQKIAEKIISFNEKQGKFPFRRKVRGCMEQHILGNTSPSSVYAANSSTHKHSYKMRDENGQWWELMFVDVKNFERRDGIPDASLQKKVRNRESRYSSSSKNEESSTLEPEDYDSGTVVFTGNFSYKKNDCVSSLGTNSNEDSLTPFNDSPSKNHLDRETQKRITDKRNKINTKFFLIKQLWLKIKKLAMAFFNAIKSLILKISSWNRKKDKKNRLHEL
jgi:hypothetical protein